MGILVSSLVESAGNRAFICEPSRVSVSAHCEPGILAAEDCGRNTLRQPFRIVYHAWPSPFFTHNNIMPVAIPVSPKPLTKYEDHYDPSKVLNHPEFRILKPGDFELKDSKANIACAYNPAHEVHMIHKPKPKPGPGEVLVHIRATGICG
jgi:hypothetical protein